MTTETMTALFDSLPGLLVAVASLVTACTAITALTPTKVDDRYLAGAGRYLNMLSKVLNVLAGNVGKNKNADNADKPE